MRLTLFLFFFLGPHSWHIEVPRLGVKSELQLPATATATPDLRCICDLHHSSQQCWILSPLSEARDRTQVLTDTSRVLKSAEPQQKFPVLPSDKDLQDWVWLSFPVLLPQHLLAGSHSISHIQPHSHTHSHTLPSWTVLCSLGVFCRASLTLALTLSHCLENIFNF